MDTQTALNQLQSAVDRCRVDDIDTPEINAALDFLEARASVKWPFNQFRAALKSKPIEDWEIEGRCQVLNAAMGYHSFTATKSPRRCWLIRISVRDARGLVWVAGVNYQVAGT